MVFVEGPIQFMSYISAIIMIIRTWKQAVSAKFIGLSDQTDKSAIGPICVFSSLTGLSDVGSGTMYMYTPRIDGVLLG